jgi:flagellar motor component MotA
MLKSGLGSSLGFLILLGVLFIAVLERGQSEITYFDWHAAVVVLGGVAGSLLLALEWTVFGELLRDWGSVIFGKDTAREALNALKEEIVTMESAWKQGRRTEVLTLLEKGRSQEVRVAADALVQHMQGQRLEERFEYLRSACQDQLVPQIEGWDMVARLAPSFGIVGTVAGMVQLFRNMANNSGNLGGAMGMALLATLYGILLGTALGGPMSTRLNQILSERLGLIDLLERQVAALIEEDRGKRRGGEVLA